MPKQRFEQSIGNGQCERVVVVPALMYYTLLYSKMNPSKKFEIKCLKYRLLRLLHLLSIT